MLSKASADSIFAVDLFVTNECNLNCSYCFHKKDSGSLSLEQGKKAFDFIKAHRLTSDEVTFNFFGGEPLLYPDLVKELIEYGDSTWKDRKIKYFISTNATYFDEEFYKFINSKKVLLQLSVDGGLETQEIQRGKANEILANVEKISKIVGNTVVRLTYTPKSVGKLAENIEFLYRLGIKSIMHHGTIEMEFKIEDINEYIRQFWKLISLREGKKDLEIHFIDYPLDILLGRKPAVDEHCGAGKGLIAIQTDGSIYPCHRAASNRQFRLGSLEEDFNRGIFKTIKKSTVQKCLDCPARIICHSCIYCNNLINNAFSEPVEWQCQIVKAEFTILRQIADRIALLNVNSTILHTAEVVLDISEQLKELKERIEELKELALRRGEE